MTAVNLLKFIIEVPKCEMCLDKLSCHCWKEEGMNLVKVYPRTGRILSELPCSGEEVEAIVAFIRKYVAREDPAAICVEKLLEILMRNPVFPESEDERVTRRTQRLRLFREGFWDFMVDKMAEIYAEIPAGVGIDAMIMIKAVPSKSDEHCDIVIYLD